jgi:hypothetical protein
MSAGLDVRYGYECGGIHYGPNGVSVTLQPSVDAKAEPAAATAINLEASRSRQTDGAIADGLLPHDPSIPSGELSFDVPADYVVSTLPLGVLKSGMVSFDPPLSASKVEAMGRLGFGLLNKVVLRFDYTAAGAKPFWNTSISDYFGIVRPHPDIR